MDREQLKRDEVSTDFVSTALDVAIEKGWKNAQAAESRKRKLVEAAVCSHREMEELRDVLVSELDMNGNVCWDAVQARRKSEQAHAIGEGVGNEEEVLPEGERNANAAAISAAVAAALPESWAAQHSAYELLTDCLNTAAKKELTGGDDRKRPTWFERRKDRLMKVIGLRNAAQCLFNEMNTPRLKRALRAAQKVVKLEIRKAKELWLEERVDAINTSAAYGGGIDPRVVWNMVKELKAGSSTWKRAATVRLKKADGTWCEGPVENAERFREHFSKVLNIESEFDDSVLNLVEQRPIREDLDEVPSVEEVAKAAAKMRSQKAAGDSKVPAEYLKVMMRDEVGAQLIMDCIEEYWVKGVTPAEWNSLRLKTLPKSGDLSKVGKWRGIYLMDSVCKLVSKVLETRLQRILKVHGMEAQNGFMGGRGCSDGIFLLYQALLKRREHQQDSWVLLVDLVKAFPSVPRDGMWAVLSKFGVPTHMLSLIKRLHTGVVAKLAVGETDIEMTNTSGTKQGDPLAAILFLFHMQACLETLDLEGVTFQTPSVGTEGSMGRGMTGARWQSVRGWDSFRLWCSLYADDAGIIFDTREKLQLGTERIYSHFKRFGLTMHVGRNGDASKTEAMYFPGAGTSYGSGDTRPLTVDGNGACQFTKSFKYLGSIFASNLQSAEDVEKRLKSAGAAFGALRKKVFASKDISPKVKAKVYLALVVSILLYGSECWTLSVAYRDQLIRFHRRCVRTMCGVSRWKTWKCHIRTESLLKRLGLRSMDHYINVRCLRWAGHLWRMGPERLPRKLLFAKLRHPRRHGGQALTYGRRLLGEVKRAVKSAPVEVSRRFRHDVGGSGRNGVTWMKYAEDRTEWRAFCHSVP
ncbi:MAG: reverse transcriptase family protein [SAR324 cluster bacterium]|nr:reverse transcriptase family protein [SAR324 cluster bacterium]